MPDSPTPVVARRLAAVSAATTVSALPAFLIGGQGVQLREELGFDLFALGLVVALAWAAASVASAMLGRLTERLGGGRSLRIAALASAAVQLLIAVTPSWGLLAIAATLGGLANSLAQPGANLLLTRVIRAELHGIGFAVKQSALPLASMLGGLAVPLVALTIGWRWTFVFGAAIALAAALAVPVRAEQQVLTDAPRSPAPPLRGSFAPLVVLAVGVAFGAAAAGGLAAFLTSGAVKAGVGEAAAGWLLTIGSALGIASRLTVGWLADRTMRSQLPVVASMMAIGALGMAAFAAQAPLVYLLATPVAFAAGWAWPGLFNLSVVRAHAQAPGAATGITQTGTYLGAALGPLVFGVVAQEGAFGVAWLLAGSWLLIGAVAILTGRRMLDSRRDASSTH